MINELGVRVPYDQKLATRTERSSLLVRPTEYGSATQIIGGDTEERVPDYQGTLAFNAESVRNKASESWLRRQWRRLDNFIGVNPHFASKLREEYNSK